MSRLGLTLALALAAAGFSPFRQEEANVREGNERVASGDAAGALPHYDAAEQAVGARAEIDYDRGVALFRQGKIAEARDAWRSALARGAGALSSRASQNLGNALAAAGDRPGAVKAFTEALRADPKNEDARFDLEVLLRKEQQEQRKREEQRSQAQQDARPQSAQPQDSQAKDASKEPRPGDQQPAPAPGTPRPNDARDASGAQQPQPQPGEDGAHDAQEARPAQRGGRAADGRLTREEAARILDAFRSHEEAKPLAGASRRATWRGHAGRDW